MRELILLTCFLFIGAAAHAAGILTRLFDADGTGLTYAIMALTVAGTLIARYQRSWLKWLCDHQVTTLLGLLGTVAGMLQALTGLEGVPGPEQVAGAATAFVTTLVGISAHLWLLIVREVTR